MHPGSGIRNRRPEDLDTCVQLLERVATRTDYPVYFPKDSRSWLTKGDEITAWVYERDDAVVGHASIRSAVGDLAADQWSAATATPVEKLAMLSRLFVDPDLHRLGIGSQLINNAVAWARNENHKVVFDVAKVHTETIAFYKRHGWSIIGETNIPLPNGVELPVVLFVNVGDLAPTS